MKYRLYQVSSIYQYRFKYIFFIKILFDKILFEGVVESNCYLFKGSEVLWSGFCLSLLQSS